MSKKLEDPRLSFLQRIDLTQTRVKLSDEPILLLCGGIVPNEDKVSALHKNSLIDTAVKALSSLPIIKSMVGDSIKPRDTVRSLRHALIRHQLVSVGKTRFYIFRPEEITNWEFNGVFENLIKFEEELGYICSLIMIILESAGSIAELGAFSQIESLKDKIVVVKSNEFHELSFIELGLLRLVNSNRGDEDGVKRYPWLIGSPEDIGVDLPRDLTSSIEELLERQNKTQLWKQADRSHHIVLICELLNLFRALKKGELRDYLKQLNVLISESELRKKLFLLEEFGIIKKVPYGSDFYTRTSREFHRLHFHYKSDGAIDLMRLKTECMQFYKNDSSENRHRLKAIGKITK